MRYFSTFSGIGGFELGIKAVDPDAEFVGYSEIDKYAIKVYERHFNDHRNYGDITAINADELPDFDCLVGGFPCQAFSIAGKRGGFDDTRGTLFFDLARILRAKRPRLCVFENVKGLISHDRGRTFDTIIRTLDELGYDCQWQVLNSKNHGVPQNRERIIIVGHLRGTPRPEVFPFGITDGLRTQPDAAQEEVHHVASTQTARQYASWGGNFVRELTGNEQQTRRLYSTEGVSPTLNTMQGGNKQPKVIDYKNPESATRRGRVKEGYTGTVETNPQIGILDGARIRRLTPVECERLQAFPDNWTQYDKNNQPISDSQRYKMCGNAVTTNVIQAVFERIFA